MLRLTIKGVHLGVDNDLSKYVTKKIGHLDKYIPRKAKASAHAEVFLKEVSIRNKKQCTCEVVLHLPKEEYVTKETTINIFAAVDIVEAKLKTQIHKYKELHDEKRKIFSMAKHYIHKN